MKKITILLNVLFFIAIKCNAGSFIDGYRSIGYWIGGGASLVAEEGAYERHNSMGDVYYSFNQRIFNYKENTVTKIVSNYGEDLKIENTKNGEAKINKWSLLKSVGITVSGPSKSNVEVYVLPNDNILYMVELEQTIIKGSLKLQDRVESVYGFPFVIEGATVPLKETDVKSWGFILDSKSKYKVLNAFPVPAHADCISSVNGRFYFMSDYYEKGCNMGYQTIHCYDFNGTCLWRYHNYSRQEWFGTFQETLDNIYLAGSEKADDGEFYGIIRVLNVKDGNTVNAMRGKGKNGAYFIYSNYFKDGFEWGYDRCEREDGGRLKYIKEDASFKAQIEKEWDEMVSNMQQRASKKKADDEREAKIEEERRTTDIGSLIGNGMEAFVQGNEASSNGQDGTAYYKKANDIFEKVSLLNENVANTILVLNPWLSVKMRLGDLEGSKSLAESLYKKLNSMTSNEEVVLVNELIGYGTLISYYIQLSDNKMVDHCVNKGLEKAKGILKSYPNNSTAKSFIDFYTNK